MVQEDLFGTACDVGGGQQPQAAGRWLHKQMTLNELRPALRALRDQLDPNNHNGAVFLGLNGVVVKSHGSANATGVANAVHVAARLLEEDITQRITSDLARVDAMGSMEIAAK